MFCFRTYYLKILFNLSIFLGVLGIFFYGFTIIDTINLKYNVKLNLKYADDLLLTKNVIINGGSDYNVWLIFTKVIDKSPLMYNFNNLILNLLNVSSVPLQFHIIVDGISKVLATKVIGDILNVTNVFFNYTFYDVQLCAKEIEDIVYTMTPHFSSRPGTYYSDALFYLSLGLHRFAPKNQKTAIILDCDLYFKDDILRLFNEFKSFKKNTLFGLAPELTPVYRHILHMYKSKHNTTFGEYYHSKRISNGNRPNGFQGYNSGVILLNLSALRQSHEYLAVLSRDYVSNIVGKYNFRGHLGDQDFYTLLGYEKPHLFRTLNCGFNRQLCVWWRDHGYKDIFDFYFKCDHKIVVLHGNCNSKIPK